MATRIQVGSYLFSQRSAILFVSSAVLFLSVLLTTTNGFYMDFCETDKDCKEVGPHMVCNQERCECKSDFILVERLKFVCYPKAQIFSPCEVSNQCTAMNRNTYCNPSNRCTCSLNYYFDGRECSIRYDSHNLKAQEVYKAAVVAAACFIVAIVGIFVACIVRRSFCRREQNMQQSGTTRNSDVFSISDEIAALRAVDKPPSYEEVLQIERTFYGIPPPEYSASRAGDNLPPRTFPMTCTSVQTTNTLERSFQRESSLLSSESTHTSSANISEASNLPKEAASSSAQDQNFLATAEVLNPPLLQGVTVLNPPPLDTMAACRNVSTSEVAPLPSACSLSVTPPPRLQRAPFVMTHLSSSLPSTPILHSHHELAFPFALQRELLLKQKLNSAVLPPAQSSMSSSSSSVVGAVSCQSPDIEVGRSSTLMAYDNPGFLSDSQDVGKVV